MKNYLEIINDLNNELTEKNPNNIDFCFNYSTDTFVHTISFENVILWDSETDDRKWLEKPKRHESLLNYIRKEFNKYIEDLQKYKL